MGAQEVGRRVAALVAAHGRRHPLEEAGHRIDVVAAARQRTDAEPVGLRFVGTGEVDLQLLHQAHARADCRHGGVAGGVATGLLRRDHRREHAQQDRYLVALRLLDAAQHVLLGDVRDFVRQHRRDFVLALGGQHQAGIHADVAAEGGEGVDLPVLEHEEGELLLRLGAVGAEPGTHGLQPVVDQRIVHQVAVVAQFAQHHAAILGLPRRGEQFTGGRADVRQLAVLGPGQGSGQGQGDGGGEQQGSQAWGSGEAGRRMTGKRAAGVKHRLTRSVPALGGVIRRTATI